MSKFMSKVESTRIGDSTRNDDVLYGPTLSEKYAKDFVTTLGICEMDGATKLWGEGIIT